MSCAAIGGHSFPSHSHTDPQTHKHPRLAMCPIATRGTNRRTRMGTLQNARLKMAKKKREKSKQQTTKHSHIAHTALNAWVGHKQNSPHWWYRVQHTPSPATTRANTPRQRYLSGCTREACNTIQTLRPSPPNPPPPMLPLGSPPQSLSFKYIRMWCVCNKMLVSLFCTSKTSRKVNPGSKSV